LTRATSGGSVPLVSTLMAAYNSERFIAEALESALSQTYERLEVIVADDGSTDSTVEIAEDYARRHPDRVVLLPRGDRGGPCRGRNRALAAARGPLICWLDADDVWLPDKVERQVEIMTSRPEVGLVHTRYEIFDPDTGALLPAESGPELREGDLLTPLFLEGCVVGSLTAMFRKRVLEERGLMLREREFAFGDDYQLWLVLSLRWQAVAIDEVLARYRRHSANLSRQHGNYGLAYVGLLEEFASEFPEARARLGRRYHMGIGRQYLAAALVAAGRRRYLRAAGFGFQGAWRDPVWFVRRLARRVTPRRSRAR